MKRMIFIWIILICLLIGAGFFRSDLSVLSNRGTQAILILLVLLLSIEAGLYYWRRKMLELSIMLRSRPQKSREAQQQDHYIHHRNPHN